MATAVYALRFERIDNQVLIIINNAVAWDSGVIHYNPPLNILVPLDQSLQPGENPTLVQLFNAPVTDPRASNPSQVRYRIEINGNVAGVVEYSYGHSPAGLMKEIPHKFRWPYKAEYDKNYSAAVDI